MTYHVLTAITPQGKMITALVNQEDYFDADRDAITFFPTDTARPIHDQGTVEITGNGLNMVPSVLVGS